MVIIHLHFDPVRVPTAILVLNEVIGHINFDVYPHAVYPADTVRAPILEFIVV